MAFTNRIGDRRSHRGEPSRHQYGAPVIVLELKPRLADLKAECSNESCRTVVEYGGRLCAQCALAEGNNLE